MCVYVCVCVCEKERGFCVDNRPGSTESGSCLLSITLSLFLIHTYTRTHTHTHTYIHTHTVSSVGLSRHRSGVMLDRQVQGLGSGVRTRVAEHEDSVTPLACDASPS